jgi:hypothetical protein
MPGGLRHGKVGRALACHRRQAEACPTWRHLTNECTCVHSLPVPTILRIHGFRIGFFQADLAEPPHVHVRKQGGDAKVWLEPVEVAGSRGFRRHELNEAVRISVQEKKHGDRSGEDSHG